MLVARINRLPLKAKLAVLVVVPLLGLSFFAFSGALDRRAEAQEAEQMQLLGELSIRTGSVLHETQKERGATAIYMGSNGERFEAELQAQRTATAEPLAELTSYLEDHRDSLPSAVTVALDSAFDQLSQLETRRSQASSLSVPMAEIITYYTSVNASFLNSIGAVGMASSNAELRGEGLAYLSFLNAKEKAGIERAQLAAAFASDEFAPGQFVTVVSLIAVQDAYLGLFENIVSSEVTGTYERIESDPIMGEVDEFRAIAIENGVGGFGVDGAEWFDTSTGRINLMKEVEDAQVAHISDRAGEIAGDASGAFYRSLFMALVIITMTGVFGVATVVALVSQLRSIAARAKAMGEGDLSGEPLESFARDEVDEVADSFNRVSSHLSKIGAQARAIADGDLGSAVMDDHVPGEIGESFSTMVDSLRTMVSQLKSGSQQLADSAGELNVASNSL
ncbi:MAG: HAMP domain-containing protein, partial [bacterium]|nr:HAMP domain-containing protein [bacterium]